jgi:hypothetical protein
LWKRFTRRAGKQFGQVLTEVHFFKALRLDSSKLAMIPSLSAVLANHGV